MSTPTASNAAADRPRRTVTSAEDIDNRFSYHPPIVPGRAGEHERVRELCRNLAHTLNETLPPGRHTSLALTHLEDVMYRANAAIACDSPHEQPQPAEQAQGSTR